MTTEEMITQFEVLCAEMVQTMKAKNHDYSKGDDPFKNLRRHGPYGVVVRMDDKLSRLDTFTNPKYAGAEAQVKDESVEDTAKDLANYAILLILLRRSLKEKGLTNVPHLTRSEISEIAIRGFSTR